jgi:hypothetical protein
MVTQEEVERLAEFYYPKAVIHFDAENDGLSNTDSL